MTEHMDESAPAMFQGMDWMIAWTSQYAAELQGTTPAIEVGPWPDSTGWSRTFQSSSGCCWFRLRDMPERIVALCLLGEAFARIAQDGLPLADVMREFSKIRIWREMRLLDTSGEYTHAFLPGEYGRLSVHNDDWSFQEDIFEAVKTMIEKEAA